MIKKIEYIKGECVTRAFPFCKNKCSAPVYQETVKRPEKGIMICA